MAYESGDIAKELTVALINRMNIPGKQDELYAPKFVANAYKIIYKAVKNPDEKVGWE